LALVTVAPSASAAPGAVSPREADRAQVLFDEAQRLRADGKYAQACPKLEESQQLDPAVGTLLYLGDCYEQTARYGAAWRTFGDAVSAARRAGQADREARALAAQSAVDRRVAKVTLRVAGDPTGLRIWLDETPIQPNEWREAIRADLGSHTLRAGYGELPDWSQSLEVKKNGQKLTVDVPELPHPQRDAGHDGTAHDEPSPDEAQGQEGGEAGLGAQAISAIVLGGASLAAVLVGGVLAGVASSTYSDSEAYCNEAQQCTADGMDLRDDAFGLATGADVSFVLAGVLAAASLVVGLTAPSGGGESEPVTAWLPATPFVALAPTAWRVGVRAAW
jgi:serine/threonine-protein kinase